MTRLWQWILALVVLIAVGIAGLYCVVSMDPE